MKNLNTQLFLVYPKSSFHVYFHLTTVKDIFNRDDFKGFSRIGIDNN